MTSQNSLPPEPSPIEYPCDFPIKVMGPHAPGFVASIGAVAQQFDPTFNPASIAQRPSSKGNYLGLTLTVHATSREQLDALYRALTSHPMVKYVL
jgi:putative lipoic acid-binding regulatory protein